MSQDCSPDCSSCGESCSERRGPVDMQEKPHEMSSIKHVIAVVSGKGGVGKSLVTSLMAVAMQKKGYRTAILDADITGPSIPTAFGLHTKAKANAFGLLPVPTRTGIDVMSLNLLIGEETDPVVWRGPIIAGAVKQFWTDVIWNDIDYMFVDMPPGTGDVPLTVFQSLPVEGIIVVISPQDLVSMIVEKAVRMADMMNIPIIGLVENMAWYECPCCHEKSYIFGKSHSEELVKNFAIPMLVQLPLNPAVAELVDEGRIEDCEEPYLLEIAQRIEALL